MKEQEELFRRVIDFLNNHIIECNYHEGCGRCDEARDIVTELEKHLLPVEQSPKDEPTSANYMQIRNLTDEEWLKLPKEEILQLYKNCYEMLQGYIALSNELIPEVKTETSTNYTESTSDFKTDEEILIEVTRKGNTYTTDGFLREDVLKAMHEARMQGVRLPSEEEIEKVWQKQSYFSEPEASPFQLLSQRFKNGINWVIDYIKGK